ncbi:hypothetical protein ACHAWF_016836 [Thalassiosira exigua]
MTASSSSSKGGGIIRSRPRYSSSSPEGGGGGDGSGSGSGGGSARPRSLADLASSAGALSAEVARGAAAAEETAEVVRHGSKAPTIRGGAGPDDRESSEEGSGMAMLRISDEGRAYLTKNDSGPPVVNADAALAVGVMGEEGQVRFCEYGDDDERGGRGGGEGEDSSSSRDRLDRRLGAEGDVFACVSDGEEDVDSSSVGSENDDERDMDILRELGLSDVISDDEDDSEVTATPEFSGEKRAFRVLWEQLARWTTPATVDLIVQYREGQKAEDRTDRPEGECIEEQKSNDDACTRNEVGIGASKLEGITIMLRRNIPRSLSELNEARGSSAFNSTASIEERQAASHLADLVRTFDRCAPAADLDVKSWRAMTTVLLAVAFPVENCISYAPPPSVRRLEMTVDEWRYLTERAIAGLGRGDA